MTSRERVLAAIRHQPLDRVPANYLGTLSRCASGARIESALPLPRRPVRDGHTITGTSSNVLGTERAAQAVG